MDAGGNDDNIPGGCVCRGGERERERRRLGREYMCVCVKE